MRLRRVLLILGLGLATRLDGQTPMTMTGRLLAPNLVLISGFTNGNVLAIVADTGVVLVDAQSEKRASLADSVLRTFTAAPVRAVITTHYHDDHTGGNAYWRARGASVIAHRAVVPRAARDTVIDALPDDYGTWRHPSAKPSAMPTALLDDSLVVAVGDERVRVIHVLPAHTDGDVVILLEHANVIHTGDILEVGGPPFIDWWSGGSLDGMIAGIDRILAMTNAETRYVPGHGPPVDRAAVLRYREMLAQIRTRITDGIASGWDQAALDRAAPVEPWAATMGGSRMARHFARLVFFGLTRESRRARLERRE